MAKPNEMPAAAGNQDQEAMPTPGASDEESQELYDIFVAQGIKIVSNIAPKIRGKASVDVLGNTLYEIVNKIEKEGQRHGISFPMSVLLHGSQEIFTHLIDMAKVQMTEEQVRAAIGTGVGTYLQNAIKTGKMTKEDVAALAKQAAASAQQPSGNMKPNSPTGPAGPGLIGQPTMGA